MANASDSTTQSPTSDTLYSKSTDSFDKDFSGWRLMKDFDFNEDNLLGKGFYGSVYKCLHLVDRRMYAIKIIPFEESDKSLREAQVMAMMNHHNVIRYHTAWIEEGYDKELCDSSKHTIELSVKSENSNLLWKPSKTLFIQMEFCQLTLNEKIQQILKDEKEKQFDESVIWGYFLQMAKGVEYIHQMGFIHGDLTNDNILFDAYDAIKIADFGLAINIKEGHEYKECKPSYGNRIYRAPEVSEGHISQKSDIYQLGLIIFEMLHRMDTDERLRALQNIRKYELPEGWKENEEITYFIKSLLSRNAVDCPLISYIIDFAKKKQYGETLRMVCRL